MKSLLIAIAMAAGIAAGPAAAAVWETYDLVAQAPWQKGGREGRGGGPGYERGGGGGGGNREARPERRDQGRERMSEEDRRSLHRDLDKANRELYGRHGR